MQDGEGEQSLSIFESSIAVTEYIMFELFVRGDIMRRIGVNRFWPTFPVGIYETKQGWLGVTTVTPAQWRAFCEMLGLLELRDDPTLFMGIDRLQRIEEIEGKIIPRLKQRTAQEWFAEGLRRKIPIVPVPEIGDLIADEEKRARGAIVPIMIGDETGFTAGSMQRLTGTPPRRGGAVPDIGEQMLAAPIVASASAHARPRAAWRKSPCRSKASAWSISRWAGPDRSARGRWPISAPTSSRSRQRNIRIGGAGWTAGRLMFSNRCTRRSVRYCIMNRNKRGITLDLTRPQGLDLAKRLLADADCVVDNYSVEVLPKLGLGYEVLSKLNPKLVMMSMSAFGAGSVHRDCRAYGSTLEQGSGLPSVVGDADGPPVMSHTAFGDAVGGLNGCAAVLTALIHAKLTGKGQFIDLAQIECMMPFAAPWIVAHSIDGKCTREIRQSPSGFRAARLLPLRRRGQLGRGRGFQRCDVAEACKAAWPRRLGGRRKAEDSGRTARHRERDRGRHHRLDLGARAGRGDGRVAGGRCRVRRGAAADRAVARPAIACARLHSGGRSRLHRQASAAVDAVPRRRYAVSDPQRAADARRT